MHSFEVHSSLILNLFMEWGNHPLFVTILYYRAFFSPPQKKPIPTISCPLAPQPLQPLVATCLLFICLYLPVLDVF